MCALQKELAVPDILSPFLASGENLIFHKRMGLLGMGGVSAVTNRRVIYVSRNKDIQERYVLEPDEEVLLHQRQGNTGALNFLLGGVWYLLTTRELLVLRGTNLSILTDIPLRTITSIEFGVSMSPSRQELILLLSLSAMPQINQPADESSSIGLGESSLSLPLDRLANDVNAKEPELLERLPRAICQVIELPFMPPKKIAVKADTAEVRLAFYPKSDITWPDRCVACLKQDTNLVKDNLKIVRKPRPNQMVPRSFGESTPVYNSIGLSSVILTIPYCPECYNRRFSSRQPNRAADAFGDFYGVQVDMRFENAEYAEEFINQNTYP